MQKTQHTITVKQPLIDKLVFLLPWGPNDADKLPALIERLNRSKATGQCLNAFVNGNRYRLTFKIPLSGKNHALVQIGNRSQEMRNYGIRITLNPSKLTKADMKLFHKVMIKIIGSEFEALIQLPRINSLHVAVDLHGAQLDKMLVNYKHNQRLTIFGKTLDKDGRIESIYFGSVSSDYRAVAYDKTQEQIMVSVKRLINAINDGESFESSPAENLVRQIQGLKDGPPVVRIEVRGVKMRGVRLWQLGSQENRFKRFQFADLQAQGYNLPSSVEPLFLSLCRQSGVKVALATFSPKWKSRVKAYWDSRQAGWWQPEPMWLDACKALKASGIFPVEAFEAPAIVKKVRST